MSLEESSAYTLSPGQQAQKSLSIPNTKWGLQQNRRSKTKSPIQSDPMHKVIKSFAEFPIPAYSKRTPSSFVRCSCPSQFHLLHFPASQNPGRHNKSSFSVQQEKQLETHAHAPSPPPNIPRRSSARRALIRSSRGNSTRTIRAGRAQTISFARAAVAVVGAVLDVSFGDGFEVGEVYGVEL